MEDIVEVHQRILSAIDEDGGRVGIALYRKYSSVYETLPPEQAAKYWRELFDTIDRKEGFQGSSLIARSDPHINEDLFLMSDDKLRIIRLERQTFYRQSDTLDAKMANYVFDSMDLRLNLLARRDQIPIKGIRPS